MRAVGRSRRALACVVALVASMAGVVGTAGPAGAAGTRTLTFTLARPDGAPITSGGVAACPDTNPTCAGITPPHIGFVADGDIEGLAADQTWHLRGFTQENGFLETSDPLVLEPGDGRTHADFVIGAAVHGTVSWPGAPAGAVVGVGACAAPERGPECPTLRFTTADPATGAYSLALPAGTWNIGAFTSTGAEVEVADAMPVTIQSSPVARNLVVRHVVVRDQFDGRLGGTVAAYVCHASCPAFDALDHDQDHTVHVAVDPALTYGIGGVGWAHQVATGGHRPAPAQIVGPGGPTTLVSRVPAAEIVGNVQRSGFSSLPESTTGVGACPANAPYPCDNVKFAFADAAGDYRFALPAGEWDVASFTLVGGAVVVGKHVTRLTVVNGGSYTVNTTTDAATPDETGVDGNGDGVPDADQDHVTTFPVGGGGTVTMVAPAGTVTTSFAAVAAGDLPAAPAGYTAPIGVLAFTLTNVPTGGSVDVSFILPAGFPYAEYWKMVGSTWALFPSTTVGNVTTITLTDGGAGDQDGTVNGTIVDPGALLVPPTPPPAFGGFEGPVTTRGPVKAGSALPVRFRATAADGSPLAAGDVSVAVRPCGGAATTLAGLRTDGAGRWEVVWKTPKGATGCHVVVVHLAGGPSHEAAVQLR